MEPDRHTVVAAYAAACAAAAGEPATALAKLLAQGDHAAATQLIRTAQSADIDYLDTAVTLLQPAMYVIGDLWSRGVISTAREHLATATVQSWLARAFPHEAASIGRARRVVCACVPQNHHAVGLRLVADAFELAGWDAMYCGANVPVPDLVQLAGTQRCDAVALSVCAASHVDAARELISALRHELGPHRPHVFIGGLAVNAVPALAREIGADEHCADALDLFRIARGAAR